MSQTFKTTRRVEFRDTDMAGIVHFSVFFAYMEEAEHEFWRSLGLGVVQEIDGEKISWPRVNAECNYLSSIRFEEEIEIEVTLIRVGKKSVTFGFQFSRDGVAVADGKVTAVCCQFDHSGQHGVLHSVAIPEKIEETLKPFVRV